jgi:hypothetical protein
MRFCVLATIPVIVNSSLKADNERDVARLCVMSQRSSGTIESARKLEMLRCRCVDSESLKQIGALLFDKDAFVHQWTLLEESFKARPPSCLEYAQVVAPTFTADVCVAYILAETGVTAITKGCACNDVDLLRPMVALFRDPSKNEDPSQWLAIAGSQEFLSNPDCQQYAQLVNPKFIAKVCFAHILNQTPVTAITNGCSCHDVGLLRRMVAPFADPNPRQWLTIAKSPEFGSDPACLEYAQLVDPTFIAEVCLAHILSKTPSAAITESCACHDVHLLRRMVALSKLAFSEPEDIKKAITEWVNFLSTTELRRNPACFQYAKVLAVHILGDDQAERIFSSFEG